MPFGDVTPLLAHGGAHSLWRQHIQRLTTTGRHRAVPGQADDGLVHREREFPAGNATDGNTATRWSSAFGDPQSIQVDLGASHTVSQVVLNWEAAFATAFQVQTSADGVTWTTVFTTTTGAGGVQTIPVSGTGQFVRVLGTARATQFGYSLWEFRVFGT
ncbi:MAG TPA: discoidin domain-containing protein [Pseudonocardiaceae bacterium]|nr:discoidin domain-containing protein [Pseudonocardiaceae bacterium]